MKSTRLHYLFWAPLLAYLVWFFSGFAWYDDLSSIANDSVNYLVMARFYSPWLPATEAVELAWQYQDFPPAFPLLLAITGAAHSLYQAHILVTVIGFLSLPVYYRLVASHFQYPLLSLFVVLAFALTPGYLFALQGILSESLYLFTSLLFLLVHRDISGDTGSTRIGSERLVFLVFLLMVLLLTRTIAVALWLAVLLSVSLYYITVVRHKLSERHQGSLKNHVVLLIIPALFYLLLMQVAGPEKGSHYGTVLLDNMKSGALWHSLGTQQLSLLDSWRSFWLIYWVGDWSALSLLAVIILLLGLAGVGYRLSRSLTDVLSWYVLIYLAVLLVWPHPGQMVRLLFPVVPLLVLTALQFVVVSVGRFAIFRGAGSALPGQIAMIMALLMLVMVLPAHAWLQQRLMMVQGDAKRPVLEFFRKVSLQEASYDLVVQNQMLDDFRGLDSKIPEGKRLLYYSPEYPAILADVPSVQLQVTDNIDILRKHIRESDADFLLLTRYHPRMTRQGTDGMIARYLDGLIQPKWCSWQDKLPVSCLYRIARQK